MALRLLGLVKLLEPAIPMIAGGLISFEPSKSSKEVLFG